VQAGELVCFDCGVKGMALNLQADHVGVVVFGNDYDIHQGDLVYRTGQIVNVPIGPGTLGRVMDALGTPIDGKGPLTNVRSSLVEVKAPGAFARRAGGSCKETEGQPLALITGEIENLRE
jgi:F0F1-type ATP synthase alpha subunit